MADRADVIELSQLRKAEMDGDQAPPWVPTEDVSAPDLFRRWTMTDLLAEPTDFDWLVKGLLANPTYGQAAGEMKTLKSYLTGFIEVGLASGLSIFDRFVPPQARPVVAYVGEGGGHSGHAGSAASARPWGSTRRHSSFTRRSTWPRSLR